MRESLDLACENLRGLVLEASDEYFAPAQNLLCPSTPRPGTLGTQPRDGWVTRRRRGAGHDWVIVRLGVPGIVEEVVLETTHFLGNYPPEAEVEGCVARHNAHASELSEWVTIVSRTDLGGDRLNRFRVTDRGRFTHLRLKVYPDGGIARLRVLGQPVPNWMAPGTQQNTVMDLAATVNGGYVQSASDHHYGDPGNLLMPGDGRDQSQGWATQRRRESGNDWAVVRLVGPGKIHSVTLDTAHFNGNHPDEVQLEASRAQDPGEEDWFELIPRQRLIGHTEHVFREEVRANSEVLWVRLNIFPDGGVSRLRVWGELSSTGYEEARLLYLNSSNPHTLRTLLRQVCHSHRWVDELIALAPYSDLNELLKKGARAWSKCGESDWKEALDGHPRIGEKAKGANLSARWSKGEQSGASGSQDDLIKAELLRKQEEYFQKFGFIFLVCATGKSSEEILEAAVRRLGNTPGVELQTVAEEQSKIIHLRLEKLLKS